MHPTAHIAGIEYHLPRGVLTNEQLAELFPEWTAARIEEKLGIVERHIAGPDECASDLAVEAAEKLFATGRCTREEIDFLLLCTQSPDHFLPTTACLLQSRLGIPTSAGALDYNLGCSGYVAGLGLAKGLIETGQAGRVLLLTAETYSKFLDPADKGVRTLFGDGAAATLVVAREGLAESSIGPFVWGTDGRGAPHLIVEAGGFRRRLPAEGGTTAPRATGQSAGTLFMDGGEIFAFSSTVVGRTVHDLLRKAGLTLDEVDGFVFHQANAYMLEHLRAKCGIPESKFVVAVAHCGNTVSSTIPIAIKEALVADRIRPGDRIMLVGFGVGLSWAGCMIRW